MRVWTGFIQAMIRDFGQTVVNIIKSFGSLIGKEFLDQLSNYSYLASQSGLIFMDCYPKRITVV